MTTHTNNTWPDEHDYSNLWPVAPNGAEFLDQNAKAVFLWAKELDKVNGTCFWGDKDGNWFKGDIDGVKLVPIPERERELNRLAEYNFKLAQGFSAKFGILQHEINERVRQRIEAGLIDDDDDDLTWLARNVDAWPDLEEFESYFIRKFDGDVRYSPERFFSDSYTLDQWLQRRRELGLEDDDGVAAALDEKAAEMAEAEPAEWVPEAGKPAILKGRKVMMIGRTDPGRNQYWSFWYMDKGQKYVHGCEPLHQFEPFETPEQKAKRERVKAISQMYFYATNTVLQGNEMDDRYALGVCEELYDANYRKSEGKL